MSAFVLDTSIAMEWFLEDEGDRTYSLAVLQSISDRYRPTVPLLWYYEIANSLTIQVRRKRLVFDDVAAFLELADRLKLPIATKDTQLILAASECGVRLLPMSGVI